MFGAYLLISDFLAESLKTNKNWQKDHLLYNTVSLKKPHLLYETQITQHCKKYTPATQPKTHSLYKFSSKHMHCTISRCPATALSKHRK